MPNLTELQRLAEPTRWHELKTDPDVFDAVAEGRKTFEIRQNDRDFRIGDGLLLRRTRNSGWAMKNTGAPLTYTGEELRRVVSHVLHGPVYGLAEGWAILSFAAMHPATAKKLIAVALAAQASVRAWDVLQKRPMGRFTGEEVPACEAADEALRKALEELK